MARTGTLTRAVSWRPEIDAACHDGVLEVTIPLTQEPKHETRTITPKAA